MWKFTFSFMFSIMSVDNILINIFEIRFLNALKRNEFIFLISNAMECYFNVEYCQQRKT